MTNKDVTKAIQAKSDQLNASDLIEPRTIKIRDVSVSDGEQPISIFYEGDDNKPWKPSKTGARCLAAIWGSNAAQWVGMSCTLFNDPTVTWGGLACGGVRVSHMQGIDKPRSLMLTKTRGKKGAVTIQPLTVTNETVVNQAEDPDPIDVADSLQSARDAANKGKDAFTEWWKANPDKREAARTIMDELKDTVDSVERDGDEVPM